MFLLSYPSPPQRQAPRVLSVRRKQRRHPKNNVSADQGKTMASISACFHSSNRAHALAGGGQ
jgi:hypothetical protein